MHDLVTDRASRRLNYLVVEHLTDSDVAVITRIGITDHGGLEKFASIVVVGPDAILYVKLLCYKSSKVGIVQRIVRRQILRKIVLPLSKPILGVLTIYYMSGHWNAYFSAIIYLSDENLMPLQVFLRRVLIMGGMEGMSTGSTMTDSLIYESLKYGIIVVSTLPMLIGYLLVQKSFKKGIMMGSLKG